MTVQVYNYEQLKIAVEESVAEMRKRITDNSLDQAIIDDLLTTVLNERKLLMDELESLRGCVKSLQCGVYFSENPALVINDLSSRVFNDFNIAAYRLGLTTGQALTRLMEAVLASTKDNIPQVSTRNLISEDLPRIRVVDRRILSVNGQELVEAGARTSFHRIEYLEFTDIDELIFQDYIGVISNCAYIKLPSSLPKLLVYAKCENCCYYEFTST